MKKILTLLFFYFFSVFTYGYWEWTPQTRKWINPKYAVKNTPKEQFEYAEEFRKNGQIEYAIREHKKLLKHYSKSEYAPQSCFILGEIYREKGDIKNAFNYYQKIIDEYPSSSLIISVIKIQSEIAEKKLTEKRGGFLSFFKKSEENAELMNKVIENDPYSLDTIDRMFKLAEFYISIKEYDKGKEILDKIIKNFPQTFATEKAKFLKIKYSLNSISEVSLDTDEIEDLKEEIDLFLVEYPNSDFKKEIENIKSFLDEKQAEKYYQIGIYYEKAGKKKSAFYYYKKIITQFPNTKYGKIVEEKINRGI
ncbi:MAG: tetratricopeptide repeat protein [bacterium]|nr:tetratricopeptide repeat protein [bacterium]